MEISQARKKWNIKRINMKERTEELIGMLWECTDFFMFTPVDLSIETFIYPTPDAVKSAIKTRFGYQNRYTIGPVEVVF